MEEFKMFHRSKNYLISTASVISPQGVYLTRKVGEENVTYIALMKDKHDKPMGFKVVFGNDTAEEVYSNEILIEYVEDETDYNEYHKNYSF